MTRRPNCAHGGSRSIGKQDALGIELTPEGFRQFAVALSEILPEIEIKPYLYEKAKLPSDQYESWIKAFGSRITFKEQHGGSLVMTADGPRLDPLTETLFLIEYPQAPR